MLMPPKHRYLAVQSNRITIVMAGPSPAMTEEKRPLGHKHQPGGPPDVLAV